MTQTQHLLYEEAIEELNRFGITGAQVYLIDLIPLIEMIWADGKAQSSEVSLLVDYLEKHVKHINRLAGHQALTLEESKAFVATFLKKRPDPELLATLRALIAPVRMAGSDPVQSESLKQSLLAACLDIGACSVTEYPFGPNHRFNPAEKRCFFEILESFST